MDFFIQSHDNSLYYNNLSSKANPRDYKGLPKDQSVKETNLDFIEGSWKNSQESAGPMLIKEPTSVVERANLYKKVISNKLRKKSVHCR